MPSEKTKRWLILIGIGTILILIFYLSRLYTESLKNFIRETVTNKKVRVLKITFIGAISLGCVGRVLLQEKTKRQNLYILIWISGTTFGGGSRRHGWFPRAFLPGCR